MLGWLTAIYVYVYTHTTGEPWTFIMRRHPFLLPLFLVPLILLTLFGVFLAGHVYW